MERDRKHPTYPARLDRAIERAAIHEFDAGMPRDEAEARAASAWNVNLSDVRNGLIEVFP
jgi:hypothetical protein